MKDTHPVISFREAGAATMLAQCRKMERHMPGARSGADPEDLRRMRVATRRLRAAMKVFRHCFPVSCYEGLYHRVSDLTDALGLVRDTDVQAEIVHRHREGLPPEEQPDIDRWLAAHQVRRDTARTGLLDILDVWQEEGLMALLQQAIVAAGGTTGRHKNEEAGVG